MQFFFLLSQTTCSTNEEAIKHYQEAIETIQTNCNMLKKIKEQIDKINGTITSIETEEKLSNYLESEEYKIGMRLINTKFDVEQKNGLALQVEKTNNIKDNKGTSETIDKLCANLKTIRQISEKSIEQCAREMPFQENIVTKQKKNYEIFFDFLLTLTKNIGGIFIFIKNNLYAKFDISLNDAKLLLNKLHELAKNVQKTTNKEDCNFKMEIEKILDKKNGWKIEKFIETINGATNKHINLTGESDEFQKEMDKKFSQMVLINAQLFKLLFSFAARLEALIHGKQIFGAKEEENEQNSSEEKILRFLNVWNSFNVPEWANKFGIFDNWLVVEWNQIQLETTVQIYTKLYKWPDVMSLSQEEFKILNELNKRKFSIYETTKLLKKIYYTSQLSDPRHSYVQIPKLFDNLVDQIKKRNANIKRGAFNGENEFQYYVNLFQIINKKFNMMMDKERIDSQKHFDEEDHRIREYMKSQKVDSTELGLINTVRYDLVMHFQFDLSKDIFDRIDDLLFEWNTTSKFAEISGDDKKIEEYLQNILLFTSEHNREEKVAKIVDLKEAEEQMLKGVLVQFDELRELVKDIKETNLALKRENDALNEMERKKKEKEKEQNFVKKFFARKSQGLEEKRSQVKQLEATVKEQTENVQKLATNFGQMLEKVKTHYGEEDVKNSSVLNG